MLIPTNSLGKPYAVKKTRRKLRHVFCSVVTVVEASVEIAKFVLRHFAQFDYGGVVGIAQTAVFAAVDRNRATNLTESLKEFLFEGHVGAAHACGCEVGELQAVFAVHVDGNRSVEDIAAGVTVDSFTLKVDNEQYIAFRRNLLAVEACHTPGRVEELEIMLANKEKKKG